MASSDAFNLVTLCENDIPGAKFVYESIEKHSNTQLKRWLECRGLPKNGDRSNLLKRIHSCIDAGQEGDISVAIDGGKWFTAKLQNVKTTSRPVQTSDVPLLPYCGWGKFPSKPTDMPTHFNKGHIHHHIVESVQFINQSTIKDDSDDIEDVHTSKPLKKGLTYFESGHVQKMQDCVKSNHYFVKSKVMASYKTGVFYDVTVTLSQLSGFVRDSSCTCVASAMGRCSHVTAVLYALIDYIEKSEQLKTDPSSCTSLPCTWNQGRKKNKNPKKVQDSLYSAKKQKVSNVINFDPRAPSTVKDDEHLNKSLLWCLGKANQSDSMWMSLLQYTYKDYTIEEDHIRKLKLQTAMLLKDLKVGSSGDYPVQLVKQQGTQDWSNERRVRLTASNCKRVASLQSESAISNFLFDHLWRTERVTTGAMAYGVKNEGKARQSYQLVKDNTKLKVIETGLWVDKDSPELAASPDGLILDLYEPIGSHYGVLEIKCPKILEGKTVTDFKCHLTKQQLHNFPLEMTDSGTIRVKESHSYFYQMQMQMAVTGLSFCDFVVWSDKETFIKRVRFDAEFWAPVKEKLINFHHSYICPEIFEMRIPRELSAYKLV